MHIIAISKDPNNTPPVAGEMDARLRRTLDGPELDDGTVVLPLLVNAAWTIDGTLVSKIGLSERLAKILSYVDQAENES
jgi:hypothetical protein